ncbi:Protein of unknown function [Marinospirillum celere]|uniref:DUF2878 domain-containing protein n=1 Tax=Marinospirillum celere TaxID=1122252 RepID=A0A1I1I546_9GAMM|nr:DUF2878 domain-containing protein [Marinospirillum celere]SFC31165.1 Protein of unknown function [Marinospirillum celere]
MTAKILPGRIQQLIINALVFQIGWFACVLGGTTPWLIVVMGLLAFHLLFLADRNEARFLLLVAALGTLVDSLWMQAGWMVFPGWEAAWIPPWLILLWMLFGTLLRHALSWLQDRWILATVLGALGGSSSYLAGAELGAAELPQGRWMTFLAFALTWALLFPLLMWIAKRWPSESGEIS